MKFDEIRFKHVPLKKSHHGFMASFANCPADILIICSIIFLVMNNLNDIEVINPYKAIMMKIVYCQVMLITWTNFTIFLLGALSGFNDTVKLIAMIIPCLIMGVMTIISLINFNNRTVHGLWIIAFFPSALIYFGCSTMWPESINHPNVTEAGLSGWTLVTFIILWIVIMMSWIGILMDHQETEMGTPRWKNNNVDVYRMTIYTLATLCTSAYAGWIIFNQNLYVLAIPVAIFSLISAAGMAHFGPRQPLIMVLIWSLSQFSCSIAYFAIETYDITDGSTCGFFTILAYYVINVILIIPLFYPTTKNYNDQTPPKIDLAQVC